ncbi:MAG: amidohydrolase [Gemmiger sp.]|nr:amidohydrolase [Gemmiger sp.]
MDTIYHNGRFYIGPGRFAQAVWLKAGRFYRVSDSATLLAEAPAACQKIDLEGKVALPGFNDSHLHLLSIGQELGMVDLYGVTSVEALLDRCRAFLARRQPPPGQTVVGNGWNQDLFASPAIPTRTQLDAVAPAQPLILNRVCGNLLCCNTAALRQAGITAATPVPPGGGIDLGPDGQPNGILRDNAIALLDPLLPPPTAESCRTAYLAAMAHAAACGITSVQTNDCNAATWPVVLAALRQLEDAGLLTLRLNLQCAFDTPAALEQFFAAGNRAGQGGKWWRVGALKLFVDGSLGARTAWLRTPYADAPGEYGLCCLSKADALAMARLANAHGLTVVAHAIGDAAIAQMLAVYRQVGPAGNPLRNGIIHCQITTPGQWAEFAALKAPAYVQPIFIDYDHTIAQARCGAALAETSYAFGTPAAQGVRICYGTDAPVESLNPFPNLYCAITRQALNGTPAGGWHPAQRVSREEALAHYTADSAWAEFAEGEKGKIAPGYLADFVVLDKDYFTVPEGEIPGIRVTRTIVGGRQVFAAAR